MAETMYRKATKQSSLRDTMEALLVSLDKMEKIFLERSLEQLKSVEKFSKVKDNGKASSNRT